jgi:hypothetical protein
MDGRNASLAGRRRHRTIGLNVCVGIILLF